MIHVQLALSCCGVARVDGPINEALVDMLAELLCYRLMIEKSYEIDSLQIDHGEIHRGMLILVTQVSDCRTASRLELYPDTPQHSYDHIRGLRHRHSPPMIFKEWMPGVNWIDLDSP